MKAVSMFAQEHLIHLLIILIAIGGLAGFVWRQISAGAARLTVIDPRNDPDAVGDHPNLPRGMR